MPTRRARLGAGGRHLLLPRRPAGHRHAAPDAGASRADGVAHGPGGDLPVPGAAPRRGRQVRPPVTPGRGPRRRGDRPDRTAVGSRDAAAIGAAAVATTRGRARRQSLRGAAGVQRRAEEPPRRARPQGRGWNAGARDGRRRGRAGRGAVLSAATASTSTTAVAWSRWSCTCRGSTSSPASRCAAGSSSVWSAPPGGRPGRTSTSVCAGTAPGSTHRAALRPPRPDSRAVATSLARPQDGAAPG